MSVTKPNQSNAEKKLRNLSTEIILCTYNLYKKSACLKIVKLILNLGTNYFKSALEISHFLKVEPRTPSPVKLAKKPNISQNATNIVANKWMTIGSRSFMFSQYFIIRPLFYLIIIIIFRIIFFVNLYIYVFAVCVSLCVNACLKNKTKSAKIMMWSEKNKLELFKMKSVQFIENYRNYRTKFWNRK